MNIKDLYIDFFKERGHSVLKSAPVVPENDASVLFNTAGMQPFVPYLLGKEHPSGRRLVNYQKCIRTNDLDEVGDKTHHTFFEMLGNWSLGDYFKEDSLKYSYEFLTSILGLEHSRLAVTVYEGSEFIERDIESYEIWKKLGFDDSKIGFLGEDNFWIAGESGPCGPCSEIFYFRSNDEVPSVYDPLDERWVEVWNNVFMEFYKDGDSFSKLSQRNVDTGMGLERISAVVESVDDNYKSSVWLPIINCISSISGIDYLGNENSIRIIADHIRTAVFISSEGIKPSNTDQGYILRRLVRRAIRHMKKLNISSDKICEIASVIMDNFACYYSELVDNREVVLNVLLEESVKFSKTLEKGLREFDKLNSGDIDGATAFKLYDTYGFPIELTCELASDKGISVDVDGFDKKFIEHQEKSRAGAVDKFKGGLASSSEMNIKYHTATHLLNAALKKVVGGHIHQKGSNITDERMRFDFNHDCKLTRDILDKVENLVNEYINLNIEVSSYEISKVDAVASGAEAMFIDKYGDIVTVYKIGDISLEICGGPHVSSTGCLGKFKIVKEEASSAGIRRIKAILE